MSEKRFIVETVAVRDKVITDKEKCYSYEDLDEIVDVLNKQQALINALKKENKELKEDLKKGFDVPIPYVENSMRRLRAEHKVDEQQATISQLKEENEQLRQFINKGRRLSVKELMDNANENELLKKKIKGLEKENEQLRKELKELENNYKDLLYDGGFDE